MININPISIFDSGIGGISVLKYMRVLLPNEKIIYFSDSDFAPYGNKSEKLITKRTLNIAEFLVSMNTKIMIIACNTATAAAISQLRKLYPELLLVGVEPGLKPAAEITQSGNIGVLATDTTLKSQKFLKLKAQISDLFNVNFFIQPCHGLANQIEKGELNTLKTKKMLQNLILPLINENVDTIVLGCTHYPFLKNLIMEIIKPEIKIIDTSMSIAKQAYSLLNKNKLNLNDFCLSEKILGYTTGKNKVLYDAFNMLLNLKIPVSKVKIYD